MLVGVCRVQLHLPESDSLKAKRRILKSLKDRLRQRFNVSVSEVGGHDLWQRATLGVAIVSDDGHFASRVLSEVVSLVESNPEIVVLDCLVEMR
jgi:uncharacterized protein YlxP (DUF503 family)